MDEIRAPACCPFGFRMGCSRIESKTDADTVGWDPTPTAGWKNNKQVLLQQQQQQ